MRALLTVLLTCGLLLAAGSAFAQNQDAQKDDEHRHHDERVGTLQGNTNQPHRGVFLTFLGRRPDGVALPMELPGAGCRGRR